MAPDTDLLVRRATLDDVPALARIGDTLNAVHHAALPGLFAPGGEPERHRAHWRQGVEDVVGGFASFLAEVDGQAVGLVVVRVQEETASVFQPSTRAAITSVAVLPAWQGRGVGRRLMRHAEEWAVAQGAQDLQLVVAAFNTRALALYRELGWELRFHVMGRTPG
jgi:ribosomal protein S18 acetylase RimI-like enzyme